MALIPSPHRQRCPAPGSVRSLVFADVDGVLNDGKWFTREPYRTLRGWDKINPADVLDQDKVVRLERLCAEAGASLVITSSWRTQIALDRIEAALRAHGFTAPIAGATPDRWGSLGGRGGEILEWLVEFAPGIPYVALDDDSTHMEVLGERFVFTRHKLPDGIRSVGGLTDEDVETALTRLRTPA